MQITSQSGAVVIDYYPTKTRSNVKLHDKVLKILTLLSFFLPLIIIL